VYTGAFARVLFAEWEDITTMTTPICANIGKRLKSMGNAMVQFFFVGVLTDALVVD
jgi:hypothetical protein